MRLVKAEDYILLANYHQKNSKHLSPWEPIRDRHFNDYENWQLRCLDWVDQQSRGVAFYFIKLNAQQDKVVAVCNVTGIIYGALQAAYIGYSVDCDHEGKGVMKSLCEYAISYMFYEIKIHRLMANYIPTNKRSEKLLLSLGFNKEGLAKKYLHINGRWQDHVLTSLIND